MILTGIVVGVLPFRNGSMLRNHIAGKPVHIWPQYGGHTNEKVDAVCAYAFFAIPRASSDETWIFESCGESRETRLRPSRDLLEEERW